MMNDAVWRGVLAQLLRTESPLQKVDHRLAPPRVHVNIHIVQALGYVGWPLVRGDVPVVAGKIFHASRPLTIFLVRRRTNRSCAGGESLLIDGVCILRSEER